MIGNSQPENPYTCVIGAGYSGLAAARYLQQYGLNFTVLERTKYVGGTWRFDPHVGVDEDGVPVSTSQYKYLKTNSPWQTMSYDGFPFPDNTPSYVSGQCFYKYIKSFVKHFDLMKYIQLRSYVKSVKKLENNWEITYTRTDTYENETVYCDFVVVAIGQYNKPHVVKFPGLDEFEGTVIHSHDYKAPEPYKNSNVLVVGGGPSGLDIGIQLQKVAKKIVHSHHFKYNEPQFPKNYIKKPDIKNFVHNGVYFNDSSFEELDHVILATGYRMHHPFLDKSSGLLLTNRYVMPLHNQVIDIREPSLMFIGISKQYINKILNAQAEYIALFIAGKFELPSEEEMLEMWMNKHSPRKLKDVNSFVTEPLEKPHTCIIGAGYSGLATARYLQQYDQNFTVFERTKNIGGTWRFDPNVGVDEVGVPVSTSQYKYLRTNSPRQSMAFTDFAFPESTPTQDYRYPELFKNRKVLLVGAGPSGLDLALQLSNITSKLVHSHHLEYNEPYFSKSYIKKPDIKAFVSNGVIFKDMTFEDVEDVIFATGLKRDYPFLDESSDLIMTTHFVLPLHNQIVNIRRPTMLFIGVIKHFMNRILDAQADYIASLISGQFKVPPQEKMLEKWLLDNGNKKLNDIHNIVPHVKKYIEDITEEANINRVPPVLVDLINFNGQNLIQNLLHYRDYEFKIIDPFNYTTKIIRNHTEERQRECPIKDVKL
ncbi:unnamed protein product [Danaus chrysippus]|uniref:Flavin-containing monooxygenase n=1 Tax=Danaus chrysippus TaxID=151541 RepID=A0A8J2QLF6_9NEOP|nr:unnamed protein product [Danaus chrysippus]